MQGNSSRKPSGVSLQKDLQQTSLIPSASQLAVDLNGWEMLSIKNTNGNTSHNTADVVIYECGIWVAVWHFSIQKNPNQQQNTHVISSWIDHDLLEACKTFDPAILTYTDLLHIQTFTNLQIKSSYKISIHKSYSSITNALIIVLSYIFAQSVVPMRHLKQTFCLLLHYSLEPLENIFCNYMVSTNLIVGSFYCCH